MISAVYGENAVSHTIYKRWYQKFRQEDFSLEDESRAGCPQKIETDELQALLDINSIKTEKEVVEQLGITQQAISVPWERFRKKANGFRMNCPKTTKIGSVILHSLCFQSFGKKDFRHKIITGDEKWILYDNPKRIKS